MDTEKAKCYQRTNIILKDICQRKNPISVGLELGLTKLQILVTEVVTKLQNFVTEVVTNPQKPCDKSRRRTLKKYISVPKSAILKLKPNKDESAIFEFTSNKEG